MSYLSSILGYCPRAAETLSLIRSPCSLPLLSLKAWHHYDIQTTSCVPRFQSTWAQQSRHPDTGNRLWTLACLQEGIEKSLRDVKCPPAEAEVLLALRACQNHAAFQLQNLTQNSTANTPTSVLLSLDERQAVQPAKHSSSLGEGKAPNQRIPGVAASTIQPDAIISAKSRPPKSLQPVTDLAYKIVSHPNVFITPSILESYISLQALIRDPSPIPAVFSLYANKPYTPPGSSKHRQPNPNQIKYAIPSHIAAIALDTAIKSRDMSICLDIIDTSYGAPSFARAKLVRRAAPAAIAGCLAPVAIYALADTMAGYQDEVDHSLALKYAFSGLLAYAGFTGSIGMVALMTANDQMVRITWIVGTPLRYRWLKEDERAALDKVAQAWGFAEPNKRGLEEGDEWELLRAVVNRKGMYLDNPSLMEGME